MAALRRWEVAVAAKAAVRRVAMAAPQVGAASERRAVRALAAAAEGLAAQVAVTQETVAQRAASGQW